MRMNAVLSNPKHPEYGQFTVPLPIPHNQYNGIMEALNAMDMGDPLARDCQMDEILGEYPILKRLEGKPVNIDELDYLAKRLDSFCYAQEGAQFQGVAVSYDYSDMTDLINLTFSCQQVTVITDFSDLEQVGRDHYMVLNGGCASKEELDALDGYETALLLIDEGNGVITPYGVGQPITGLPFSVPCAGREIPVWVHPARSKNRPVLFELHGGGFVLGDGEKCDGFCELLAQELDMTVVGVGYRLAPEYPYPAAVEDVYEVVRWFAQHPDRYSIDPEQMVVMGYSAGANLATVCAMLAKERGEFALKGQILCYPYLDSVHQPGEKPHFAADMDQEVMEAFVQLYCTQAQRTDPHVSPVCATPEQLRGLCPALVLLAEWDALRQEGEHYVRMLQEAGVDTEYRVLNQTHHGFLEDWANRPCYEALPSDVREKHDPAFQQAAQWAVTILERFVRRICQPEGPTDNTKD